MSNDSTGKPGPLSLVERAKQGLLLSEHYLAYSDVLFLECDAESEKSKAFNRVLSNAIQFGDVKTRKDVKKFSFVRTIPDHDVWMLGCVGDRPTKRVIENRPVTTVLIEREAYRAWRAQCPKSLLSEFSQIEKWLGATPAVETIPPAEPIPPTEPTATTARPAEPSRPETIAKGGAAEKSRKTIALVEMENAALVALRKELEREPDFDEFWDYLTTRDDTGTVADCTNDRLDWIGRSEKSCSTAKATIRNRLTQAKRRNPFKPS